MRGWSLVEPTMHLTLRTQRSTGLSGERTVNYQHPGSMWEQQLTDGSCAGWRSSHTCGFLQAWNLILEFSKGASRWALELFQSLLTSTLVINHKASIFLTEMNLRSRGGAKCATLNVSSTWGFYILATLGSLWVLSSMTRDQTRTLSSETMGF